MMPNRKKGRKRTVLSSPHFPILHFIVHPYGSVVPLRAWYYAVTQIEVEFGLRNPTQNLSAKKFNPQVRGLFEGHVTHWEPVTDGQVHEPFGWG